MRPYWISWYCVGGFTLESPWWITGETADGQDMICAAIMAESEDDARRKVVASFDDPCDVQWRFCDEKPEGWAPFGGRFPRADWMVWPR